MPVPRLVKGTYRLALPIATRATTGMNLRQGQRAAAARVVGEALAAIERQDVRVAPGLADIDAGQVIQIRGARSARQARNAL